MGDFLSEIEQPPDPGAISVYIPPGFTAPELEDLLQKCGAHSVPDELSQIASDSNNGAILFWGDTRKCLVLPPFPLSEKITFGGYVTKPLRLLLNHDFMIGLVLVHLGSYAVGICQGEKLISSKVGTGLVHGRHAHPSNVSSDAGKTRYGSSSTEYAFTHGNISNPMCD